MVASSKFEEVRIVTENNGWMRPCPFDFCIVCLTKEDFEFRGISFKTLLEVTVYPNSDHQEYSFVFFDNAGEILLIEPFGENELYLRHLWTGRLRGLMAAEKQGIKTVQDLKRRTAAELLAIKDFGQSSLVKVRKIQEHLSLELRDDNQSLKFGESTIDVDQPTKEFPLCAL